jgi:hypothetical protein
MAESSSSVQPVPTDSFQDSSYPGLASNDSSMRRAATAWWAKPKVKATDTMRVRRNGILDRDPFLIFISELLIKKPFLLSEEWVLAVGQPRHPG